MPFHCADVFTKSNSTLTRLDHSQEGTLLVFTRIRYRGTQIEYCVWFRARFCSKASPSWRLMLVKGKGMVLYSAISSPLDRSKRFTLSSPGRPVHSDIVLGFSWKHSSHAAIAQQLGLFTHISTTVYSQVLIYTAESTEAS